MNNMRPFNTSVTVIQLFESVTLKIYLYIGTIFETLEVQGLNCVEILIFWTSLWKFLL